MSLETLPTDLLYKVFSYLGRDCEELLPPCGVCRTWRKVATCDSLWAPACERAVGKAVLQALGVTSDYFTHFTRRRRCLSSFRAAMPRDGEAGELPCEAPPADFFADYAWVVEIRDERRLGPPVFASVLPMRDAEERGRLFTSGGCSVGAGGLRLHVDVKARLPGAATAPPAAGQALAAAEEGAAGAKEEEGTSSSSSSSFRWRFEAPPAALAFDLYACHARSGRLALLVSDVLLPERAARWIGRDWDGPFKPPAKGGQGQGQGQPSAWVALDEEGHVLRATPAVDVADWGDKVYLLGLCVDLSVCMCEIGHCECRPQDGMLSRENHDMLFRYLLTERLTWF